MRYIGILLLNVIFTCSIFAGITPETATLKNGLKVVVLKNPLLPSVFVYTKYEIGTADDPSDLVGLSHMLEHMMFKGANRYPGNSFNREIINLGGSCNAHTSCDETVYTISLPANTLDKALDMEADRMENLNIREEDFLPEQKVVLEERQMRLGNHPFKTAAEIFQRAMYSQHPYGIFPIGYEAHINAYTVDALINHYKKWYVPNNATILIIGPFDLNYVLPMVEEKFGSINSSELGEHKRIPEPKREGLTTTIEQENPRAENIYINISYRVPTFIQKPGQYLAMQMLESTLFDSDSRFLYEKMVKEHKLALGVSGTYTHGRDDMDFSFELVLSPEMNVEKAEEFLFEQLNHFLKKGLIQKDFDHAKKESLNGFAFAMDGEGFLQSVGKLILDGFPIEMVSKYEDLLKAVTIKDAETMLKLVLNKPPVVIGRYYPVGKMPKRPYHKAIQK